MEYKYHSKSELIRSKNKKKYTCLNKGDNIEIKFHKSIDEFIEPILFYVSNGKNACFIWKTGHVGYNEYIKLTDDDPFMYRKQLCSLRIKNKTNDKFIFIVGFCEE